MFKKYLETSTQKERDSMLSHGQLGLEKHREYLQPKPMIEREKIPEFFMVNLKSMGHDTDDIKYIDQIKNFILTNEDHIEKAEEKFKLKYIRIMVSLNNNSCYYSHIDHRVHGDIVTYIMALGDIELKKEDSYYKFVESKNTANKLIGFEIDRNYDMFFSESYSYEVFEYIFAERKDLVVKCHSILRQYFDFNNFYVAIHYDNEKPKTYKEYIDLFDNKIKG